MYSLKKIFLLVSASLFLITCSTVKYVPTDNKTIYNYIDSLRIKDSTIIYEKTIVKNYVMIPDTLIMENNMAVSKSFVDTSLNILKGSLKAKDTIKYKYVFQDRIIQKDSIIVKEVPIEVEIENKVVPNWCWYSLILNIIFIVLLVIKIILKFK